MSDGAAAGSRGVGGGGSAVLDILLEAGRYRQSVDEVQADVPQDGELAEMLQRVHTAEPRHRMQQADRGRHDAGPARQ